ncbi:glycosyltransferase family 39 protein [Granulicella sp. S190]|uniref:glycosyltransferase family 39 protein n=1 Tax=Granulicella sp. S190 TaxID=1747226 RepID=UPI00131C08FE|nr:glycosyltransferase family 39 protein [Granulicella sp. S190]
MSSSSDFNADHSPESFALPWPAVAFLILTAVLSLLWSHHKLMSQDEFFVLQTDNAPTYAQLLHIQRTYPISLDPLVYHTLVYLAIKAFGAGAFALRLPSLLGYLLMQLCLFYFVRRIANERAAIFALAFPALTATLFYAAEGRPYGLLLGLYALAMLSWQTATRRPSQRTASLIVLAAAIALTLNTHYFGILLLPPVCAAELFRTIQRRKLDLPVLAVIVAGMASIVCALPFQKAAGEFRRNYYNAGEVGYHAITQAYRSLFVDYTHASLTLQHFAAIGLVLFAAILLFGTILQLRSKDIQLPEAELVLLIVLAALPFFGFLLARFVTHTIEVRYVLGAIVALTALLAIALLPLLRSRSTAAPILSALALAILCSGAIRIHAEQAKTSEVLAALVLPPQVKAALLASPSGLLYIQDMGTFETASYYQPDPDVRSRTTLVYSTPNELLWDHHDTASLTALHMRNFTRLRILPYEQLSTESGPHVFVLIHSGWNWTDETFAADHDELTPLGSAMKGDAVSVRFAPQPDAQLPK